MIRTDWIRQRGNDKVRTQMYYARQGMVTGEMEYVARRTKRGWRADPGDA